MSSSNKHESVDKTQASLPDVDEMDAFDKSLNPDKMKVECICPKCGQKHIMNFYWVGRGIPRKYCQVCKGSF